MGTLRRWTAKEDTRIREMFAAGCADREIAAALDRPVFSTRDRRAALGLKWRTRGTAPAPEPKRRYRPKVKPRTNPAPVQDELLALLRERGPMTTTDLARAGGRSRDSADSALRQLHERGQVFPEAVGTLPRHGLRWTATAWWVEHNRGAFYQTARRWCHAAHNAPNSAARAEAIEEFTQDMVEKVYKLARTYQPFRGATFFSYMYAWAANHVARDRTYYDLPAGIRCGAKGSKGDPDAWKRCKAATVSSLSQPLDDTGFTVGDTILDTRAPWKEYPREWWDRVTASLRATDRAVILARYRDHRTLQSVADEMGRTRERVRQYEARGLNRLRELIEQGKAPPELTEWDG